MRPGNDREDKTKAEDAQDVLRRNVDLLFSGYVARELGDELQDIASFFSFLGRSILPERLEIAVSHDLLERFEPVYLLLLDKLLLYPASIRNQVQAIEERENLCNLIAIAGVLRRSDPTGYRLRRPWYAFGSLQLIRLFGVEVALDDGTSVCVNKDTLFKLQVALGRLAGIVRYASSIQYVDRDETLSQFKRNYDPDLVDRSKLLALVNIVRVQVNLHPASEEKDLLLTRLERVEQELRRPKVHWGLVISSFFVLFGFLADLKALKPDIYSGPYEVVQRILATLHQDGVVSTKTSQTLPAPTQSENENQGGGGGDFSARYGILPKREETELPKAQDAT